jgi:HAD superfamily hydrolase (TIGR01662 family)
MSRWQAVFLDRDGTIGGTGRFVHPNDFSLYEGVLESIHLLRDAGLKVFAFTNQHRISRGEATFDDFRRQFEAYGFDDSLICPHAMVEGCRCRKPNPGMLYEAAEKYGLDLGRCVVVGDAGDTDMLAAHAAGCAKVLVRTGWGEGSLNEYRDRWTETEPDDVAADLNEAVKWILQQHLHGTDELI